MISEGAWQSSKELLLDCVTGLAWNTEEANGGGGGVEGLPIGEANVKARPGVQVRCVRGLVCTPAGAVEVADEGGDDYGDKAQVEFEVEEAYVFDYDEDVNACCDDECFCF
jgi:hypothetical protein